MKKALKIRGMRPALTAFVGLFVIYIAFGLINPNVTVGINSFISCNSKGEKL